MIEKIALLKMPEGLESTPVGRALREALLDGEHKPAVGSSEYHLLVAQWEDLVLAAKPGSYPVRRSVVFPDGASKTAYFIHSNGDGTCVVRYVHDELRTQVPIRYVRTEYGEPLMYTEYTRLME